jgi:hypothetical protein
MLAAVTPLRRYPIYMPSNPLTPVQITDKNGKHTTVHKKTSVTPKRARNIPAPKHDYMVDARAAMLELNVGGTYAKNALATLAYIAEKSPKLMKAIKEQCAEEGMKRDVWMLNIRHRILFGSSEEYVNLNNLDRLLAMNEILPLAIEVSRAKGNAVPGAVDLLIDNTYGYGNRFRGEWSFLNAALIADSFIVPEDADAVIFGFWQRIPEITDLLPELARRGKIDKDTLETLLDSENVALRDGEL